MFDPTSLPPIGAILPWAKTLTGVPALPAGWAECNGATVADVSSPLNGVALPDLNTTQRFLRGAGTSGGTGGADTNTLAITEIPAHTHTLTGSVLAAGGAVTAGSPGTLKVGAGVIGSAGGLGGITQPHNNMPAYYQVVYIIRIK